MCCLIKNLIKLALFLCNFVIWVAGGVLLGVAIWIIVDEPFADQDLGRDDIDFDFSMLDDVIYLMLTVGICLFFVGFFGCCGVWKSSRCMLLSYCVLMGIIIALEVTAVGLMASFSSSLGSWMDDNALEVIQTRYINETSVDSVSEAVNYLQIEKMCCGADGYGDYEDSNFYKNNPTRPVPYTCCKGQDDENEQACYNEVTKEPPFVHLNPEGCIDIVKGELDDKTVVMYAVLGVVIFFQVILMALIFVAQCCCLDKDEVDENVTV